MEKKKLRERLKDWANEHKEGLLQAYYWTAGVMLGTGIGAITIRIADSKNLGVVHRCDLLKIILGHASKTYAKKRFIVYGQIPPGGYTPAQLGELGQNMINAGCSDQSIISHILIIGPEDK